jgi:hypothetical protein
MSIEDMNTSTSGSAIVAGTRIRRPVARPPRDAQLWAERALASCLMFSIANTIEVHSAKNGESHD